jgi:hypothetical protein
VDPAAFQVEHAGLRLPGAARHVMVGPLPGTQLEGAIALVDAGVEKSTRLSSSASEAMQSGIMGVFGMGPDDDRTYDAVIFDAAGSTQLDPAALTSAASLSAATSASEAFAGAVHGHGFSPGLMFGAFQALQGMSQRVIADGNTLACVRASSRRGRSAAELDSVCAQAASVAASASTQGASS